MTWLELKRSILECISRHGSSKSIQLGRMLRLKKTYYLLLIGIAFGFAATSGWAGCGSSSSGCNPLTSYSCCIQSGFAKGKCCAAFPSTPECNNPVGCTTNGDCVSGCCISGACMPGCSCSQTSNGQSSGINPPTSTPDSSSSGSSGSSSSSSSSNGSSSGPACAQSPGNTFGDLAQCQNFMALEQSNCSSQPVGSCVTVSAGCYYAPYARCFCQAEANDGSACIKWNGQAGHCSCTAWFNTMVGRICANGGCT